MSTNGTTPQVDPRLDVLLSTDKYYMVAVEYLEVKSAGSIITSGKVPQITAERKLENRVINVHPITFALQNQGQYPYFAVIYDRMISKREYEAAMLLINSATQLAKANEEASDVFSDNLIDASDKFTNEGKSN